METSLLLLPFSQAYDTYAFKTFFVLISGHFTDEIYLNTTTNLPLRDCLNTKHYQENDYYKKTITKNHLEKATSLAISRRNYTPALRNNSSKSVIMNELDFSFSFSNWKNSMQNCLVQKKIFSPRKKSLCFFLVAI